MKKYQNYGLTQEQKELRLAKRLCYLLRYGAEKEGLAISDGGFIELKSLMEVSILRYNTRDEILESLKASSGHNGVQRFEIKLEHGLVFVRATYGRRMERNPYHEGTKVTRLLESCINRVCDNLDDYDLSNFPDEFLITTMIHKMRREQRLNNKTWKSLLVPILEHLDLGAVYLTENTFKLIGQRCPHLKIINMRHCSYIATDHVLANLLKKLPHLETLNMSGCHHITDSTLQTLAKRCPNIQHLSASQVPLLTQQGVLNFISKCNNLQHLDLSENKNFTEQGIEVLQGYCQQKNMTIILQGVEDRPDISSGIEDNPSLTLDLASVGKYW